MSPNSTFHGTSLTWSGAGRVDVDHPVGRSYVVYRSDHEIPCDGHVLSVEGDYSDAGGGHVLDPQNGGVYVAIPLVGVLPDLRSG